MSNVEDIIKRILALKPNLSMEAVERLINEERAKAEGLLTEEAAAHLVASNLGLDSAGERIEAKVNIGDLISGLNDVSISARVIHVFEPRTFERRDGRQGKVLRMLVGDKTGYVAVTFWDDKADHVIASKISSGKIIRILHGYSRERNNEIEINIGNRGQVFMQPLDAVEEDFPLVDSYFRTPTEIHRPGLVNLIGVVVNKFPISVFNRKDGEEGKVSRMVIEEGGGQINLVLWDDKVDEAQDITMGSKIRVIGGNARERDNGGLEVHTNFSTVLEVVEEGVRPLVPLSKWTKIADLKNGLFNINVAGRVSHISDVRNFNRSDGTDGRVASVLMEDETGTVRLSLWDDDVDLINDLSIGTLMAVENGYTRESLGDIGLNCSRNGKIIIEPKDVKLREIRIEDKIIDIKDLREGESNVYIRGRVLEAPIVREVETSRGPTIVASFRIDDGTGEARVSVWRELVNQVEEIDQGALIRIENCQVREPFDGLIQVSSNMFTKIVVEEK